MFTPFTNPKQLIKEETQERLVLAQLNKLKVWGGFLLILALVLLTATLAVGLNLIGGAATLLYAGLGIWLITANRSITFDASLQTVTFSTRYLLFEQKNQIILFADIKAVYLDYEEHIYPGIKNIIHLQERIWRKWFIFLNLNTTETLTVAHHQRSYPLGQEPVLSKQTTAWEKLAQKICTVTGKLLIRTPSVPGRAPRTFVDIIDQILQRRLATLSAADKLANQAIRLRSHPTGSLEILVNGANYRDLNDIPDPDIRDLIQEAVDEWHRFDSVSGIEKPLISGGEPNET